jgi:hypothetical protein
MSKIRWAKWFWADWSNDTALNLCSIPARGLWMALLCVAAQGEPYGTISIKGRRPTEEELRTLCHHKKGHNSARDFRRWWNELIDNGVINEIEVIPPEGSQLPHQFLTGSSRMAHDGLTAMKRRAASLKSWRVAGDRQSPRDLHMQTEGNGKNLHKQNPILHTTEAEAEAEEEPPKPPKRNPPRKRQKEDNGWTQLAKRGN